MRRALIVIGVAACGGGGDSTDAFDEAIANMMKLAPADFTVPDPQVWGAEVTTTAAATFAVDATIRDGTGELRAGVTATASVLYDDFFLAATQTTTTDAGGHAHFEFPTDDPTRGAGHRFVHVTAGPAYPLVEKIIALPDRRAPNLSAPTWSTVRGMHKCLALSLVVLSGCPEKKEDYTKQQPPPEPERPSTLPPPPKKLEIPSDLGKCTLSASGAVTAEQETPGGKPATNVSYWFDESERKNMMGVDGFVVNCQGDKIRFSIVPGGGKVDGMPFSPKKYEFKKGAKSDANVMVGFGKAAMSDITGTVDVTAFDARHIAGTVDLSGNLVPGGGAVKLTGSFDLICPGFKGCQY